MKSLLLLAGYILISFLFTSIFTQWSETYIYWYTWRMDNFMISQQVLYYIIPFTTYLFIRYFARRNYKIILLVDYIYIAMLYYYITIFIEDFRYMNVSLFNASVTSVLYVYMLFLVYFLVDWFYISYVVWKQLQIWIKSWGWKFKLK